MSEEDLIRGCIEENEHCQRLLYEKYASKMFAVSLRYSANREEAEDSLQEAFIKVFDKISDFRSEGSLEGWIRRIVVNTSLKSKLKKFEKYERGGVEDYEMEFDARVFERLSLKDLHHLLNQLPDGYRTVFNLYAIEGYSHREIAQMLGIEETTSRSQFHRAKGLLKQWVERFM